MKKDGKVRLMETAFARSGEVEIAYETFGAPGGAPLLLLSGLDYQMVWWPEALCAALAGRGFHVVRFDYRDSGLSTHFTGPAGGGPWRALLAGARTPPYRVQDMVQDALAVLDALGWHSAHLLGVSMGAGMAQLTALLHPGRVRTLTLVSAIPMGGSPLRMLPYLHLGAFARLATRRYGPGRAEQERMLVDVLRATCTSAYPLDEDWARRTAAQSYDRRPPDPAARQRQLAAGRATKIPKGGLAQINAPTLVIHGEADPLVRPAASRALGRAVPGARLVTYPGMGHGLPTALWPAVLDEIAALTGREECPAHSRPALADSGHSDMPRRGLRAGS
jgi:pimeloyl-ACP methyl ester carboxylesterase